MTEPDVTVVVPTRNRAGQLSILLEALANQTLARRRFEVIVVDDGSTDRTPLVLAGAGIDRPLRRDGQGPASARQAGWRAASAALIAFTDDDCRPEADWLEAGLAAQREAPGAIVQGRTRPEPEDEHLLRLPRAHSIRVETLGPYFQTCNIFYPKALLERIGGFDESIPTAGAEDTDLALRALGDGARAVFAAEAVVNHAVTRPTLSQAVRRSWRWRTQVDLIQRHPELRAAFPWRGRFWRETHARLVLALVGLALARRERMFLLWCVPYLSYRHGWSPRGLATTMRELPGHVAVDGAELTTLALASARRGIVFL